MWYAVALRFIRRRLVLAVIFCLSLIYCLVNLLGNGSPFITDAEFDYIVKRDKPIVWQIDTNATTNDLTLSCRNSIQGKALIVDDRGYLCYRSDVLWTGCCNTDSENSKRYSCETCAEDRCCAIYEQCVSCCLNPNKKELLEQILLKATGHQLAVFSTVKDQFELCLSKCRTDSHSVQFENKYRNPKSKHCYGLTEAHESQRNPNDINSVVKKKK